MFYALQEVPLLETMQSRDIMRNLISADKKRICKRRGVNIQFVTYNIPCALFKYEPHFSREKFFLLTGLRRRGWQ